MSNGTNTPYGVTPYQNLVGGADITKIGTFLIGQTDATGQTTYGTSIYAGDPVVMAQWNGVNAGAIIGVPGTIIPLSALPAVAQANAQIVGYLMSVRYYNPTNIYSIDYPFWQGGTNVNPGTQIIAYVNIDPNVILQVQVSTSTNTYSDAVFLNGLVNINGSLSVAGGQAIAGGPAGFTNAPNPLTGNNQIGTSAYYLDGSTLIVNAAIAGGGVNAGAPQGNFKVMGVVQPTSVSNIGNPNVANAKIINSLVPGVNMPFINVFGKFNNHIYSSGTSGPILVAHA